MFSSRKFLYSIAVLLSATVYHSISAQMSARQVGLYFTGPATVDERTVVSSVIDESKRLDNGAYPSDALTNEFADSVIDFIVFLDSPLNAGERVEVPLRISASFATLSDYKSLAIATNPPDATNTVIDGLTTATVTVNTGVGLKYVAPLTTTPSVIFEGAGAQVAALRLIVQDDNELEENEVVSISVGNTDNALSTFSGAGTLTFTIRDDEYELCPSQSTYLPSEADPKFPFSDFKGIDNIDGINLPSEFVAADIPISLRVGQRNTHNLQYGILAYFQYIDLTATSQYRDETDDPIDYLTAYNVDSFVYIPAGSAEFILRVPIIDDTEIEQTELVRIKATPPNMPDGTNPCDADILIIDNDPLLSIGTDSDSVMEGNAVAFRIMSNVMPPQVLPVNLRISQTVGDTLVSQSTATVFITTDTRTIVYNAPTVNSDIGADGLLRVEIVNADDLSYYTEAQSSSATLSVLSDEIVVSISAETDAVDERIPGTSTYGFIDFSVSLNRPLVAGERAAVPLITSGTITARDIRGITIATVTPGIRLQDAATTPTVLFEGAGAQVAALRLSFVDNSNLDGDKTVTLALGELRAPVVANPASAAFSVTRRDDEYTFCFDQVEYYVSEGGATRPLSEFEALGAFNEDTQRVEVGNEFFDPALEVGIATATLVFARGGLPKVGLQEETDMRFRYISLNGVKGSHQTNDIDDVDYITSYEFPLFVKIPAGTPQYVLEFPIINDATIEDTQNLIELIRIASIPPRLPRGFIRCITDFHIEDSTLVGIGADSDAVPEGDTASFTLIPDAVAGGDFTIQLNVSESGGGDYVAATDEGMRSIDIRAGQTAVALTIPTVADGMVAPDSQLRVEITDTGGYGNPNQAQDFPQSLFATLTIRHVSAVTVAANSDSVFAGDDMSFTVMRDGASANALTVTLNVSEAGGTDYVAAGDEGNKTVTIPADQDRVTFTVATVPPSQRCAASGRFTVAVVSPQNGSYITGTPATAAVAIVGEGGDTDVDIDDDGLMEICYLEQLDAIRYRLDGSGRRENAVSPLITAGCGGGNNGRTCVGYELSRNLDFKDPNSYRLGRVNPVWSEGLGWQPIGNAVEKFSAQFEGNGYAIVNLLINRPQDNTALFAAVAESATIGGILLSQVDVNGKSNVGSLVGINEGIVANIDVLGGRVVGSGDDVGGLIGVNRGTVLNNNVILERLVGGGVQLRCCAKPASSGLRWRRHRG